ncbi:MAG: HD-GYP domain-containing protein [Magnetococcales bacterium]|nr:HD-GYP domain-containing protein [Magnetococcales bacterium]
MSKHATEEDALELLRAQMDDLDPAPARGGSNEAIHQGMAQVDNLAEELPHATETKARARKIIGSMFEDVRMGQQINVGPIRETVKVMAESMFTNRDALLTLAQLKQHDEYTFMHSVNVGVFLMSFHQTLGMDSDQLVEVGIGGMLHDIGKMRTPPEVLNKEGKLTDEEYGIMKGHVPRGVEILSRSPGISQTAISICAEHHERYNGTGYMNKLKGDEISLFGQMAAIVDVYDAITSDRCYHKGNDPHVALQRMLQWSERDFNVDLFHKFVQCVGIYPTGSLVKLENGLLAVVITNTTESVLHPVVKVVYDTNIKQKVEPEIVDLLVCKEEGLHGYKILGRESSTRWGLTPRDFMPQPKLFDRV